MKKDHILPSTKYSLQFVSKSRLSIYFFSICEILKFSLLLFNQQTKHFQLHVSAYRSTGVFQNCNTSHIAFTGEVIHQFDSTELSFIRALALPCLLKCLLKSWPDCSYTCTQPQDMQRIALLVACTSTPQQEPEGNH